MTQIEPDPTEPLARHSAQDWEDAQRDYLDGCSARVVAERHGFSERTVRRRAAEEGWRRLDHPARRPWIAPEWPNGGNIRGGDPDGDLARQPALGPFVEAHTHDLANLLFEPDSRNLGLFAFRRAAECAAAGGAAEALSWMRLAEATGRAGARLDRLTRPFDKADYIRAMYAERLRDLDEAEPDTTPDAAPE